MSHVTCQVLYVTFIIFIKFLQSYLVCWLRVCFQRDLPRQVLRFVPAIGYCSHEAEYVICRLTI